MNIRSRPYVWVTWITGLLATTDKCYWKAWVKSHYQLPKAVQTPDDKARLDEWMRKHDSMTVARAKRLQTEGWTVRVEDQNSFKLEGGSATLSGKPDIVATKDMIALIVDEKAGKAKDQYVWQVLLYMLATSMTYLKGYTIRGEIEYPETSVNVHPSQLSESNRARIVEVMAIVGGEKEPKTSPSREECMYCDIAHCKDRYQDHTADASHLF